MVRFPETCNDSNMLEILKCYSFSNSLPSQIANKENVSCSYSQRLGTVGLIVDSCKRSSSNAVLFTSFTQ